MSSFSIAVVGLGYVGLPLAVALARRFSVIGLDRDATRVKQLKEGFDRTGEIDREVLKQSSLKVTADAADLTGRDIYIIAVPTPVDEDNRPDLGALLSACREVGGVMAEGAVVVVESTVYPGVTEDICAPELEAASGLECGTDFFMGYSPERINPGDREHTVERIIKVVAGQTPEVTAKLKAVYGAATSGGVFVARDIKTAEAAKVIENAQRDINIAFINEAAKIFGKIGVSMHDVLEAASTKWNFLNFKPGFVGGHCIGVDPYYLAHCAQQAGYHPEVVLAGRRINDGMGAYVAECIAGEMAGCAGKDILVLGLTFKENVTDLRNSKVADLIGELAGRGFKVEAHDPMADPGEALKCFGVRLLANLDQAQGFDCVIGAVAHRMYGEFDAGVFARLLRRGGLVADIKGIWRGIDLPEGVRRWEL
ncbi:MAG: UDP-N-acetyl-D-galactosamine dehydrogenase [Rhodospirillales bacterium RIFCSPLOWO2_12_FULL_58_28]|nr:MAG: UDP-N-acetyl-D-galactosamine dehydrogenase [Rhodospirillales bacterium RIFCSPLOWO2_12_FULL_58_28]